MIGAVTSMWSAEVRLKPDTTYEQCPGPAEAGHYVRTSLNGVAPLNSQTSTSLLTSRQKRPF